MTTETLGSSTTKNRVASRQWQGTMISPLSDAGEGTQSSFLATEFELASVDSDAILHISAQGLYRVFINGERVGNDLLTPGWTCYDDRIAYQSYPISNHLRAGSNTIEIWLADGWYRSPIMWRKSAIPNCWGDRIAAIADIESSGNNLLSTNSDWQSGLLPVMSSGIYAGEIYDARQSSMSRTHGVEAVSYNTANLVPHEADPVRELAPLSPVESWKDENGNVIYDFAQNCGAVIRISAKGDAGATVRIEHSEVVGPEKEFDNRNLRTADCIAQYTLSGEGVEQWQPAFTFMGFRYARVTITGNATVEEIHSIPISSVPEETGGFTCGDEAVNRLVLNTVWSQRSNFIEIPTDCPQRDERLGWTGDAQVFAGTACWLADSGRFLTKYMRDVMHDQRPSGAVSYFSPDPTRLHAEKFDGDWAGATGWGDAIAIIPWQLYLHYGDASVLGECFPAMLKWLDYLWDLNDGPIIQPSSEWAAHGFSFGDWLQPTGDSRKPRSTVGDDCAATMYHAIAVQVTADVAAVLGEGTEAIRLSKRFEEIKTAFSDEYISPNGRLGHNDQTSYALCFLYDLIPDKHFEAAKSYFRTVIEDANYLIGTGFIGTPALLPALTKIGLNDLAEKVFLNHDVPGWLYQVDKGATTIWERWDALGPNGEIYDPFMNSYNHYAYGAVCQWLFESVAGVTPTAIGPGFDQVTVSPIILPELGHAAAWHDCRHGRINAAWRLDGQTVTYDVTLPEGCEGRFIATEQYKNIRIGGTSVAEVETKLPSGTHQITFDIN